MSWKIVRIIRDQQTRSNSMEEAKKEGESCCSSSGGCGCGGCCVAGKALIALILLLIGGFIGYLLGGSHCGMKKGCMMMGMGGAGCPMSAPQHDAPPSK
jgi:hypothetical protein